MACVSVANGRSTVAGLKTRATVTLRLPTVAVATDCYGYATLLRGNEMRCKTRPALPLAKPKNLGRQFLLKDVTALNLRLNGALLESLVFCCFYASCVYGVTSGGNETARNRHGNSRDLPT